MKILRGMEEIEGGAGGAPSALALGAFDGLHRGHQAVIRAALEFGKKSEFGEENLEAAVFTFDRSPSGAASVLTGKDKEHLLREMGVRRLYTVDFPSVRELSAEEFVREVLFARCGAKRLCCGEDFRFGRGAAGDAALLERLCREQGASITVVPPVLDEGEKVSSTRIRQAVERGDIPLANRLLGRPFGFTLEVIHGNHIGAELGTPTINQAIPEGFTLPPFGVYASWVQVEGGFYYGVTNIGVKPTVGSDRVLSETWLPKFSGDLYGREIHLSLLRFIRPERKFPSLDALKDEIIKNAREAETIAAEKAIF